MTITLANVVIGSQLSYRALEHMDTQQFCGQSCHVMQPEFKAHQVAPHEGVGCASCHIAPGANGWLHAKMAGTNQLIAVIFNSYPRPIESATENNKLVSSADTCEPGHSRQNVTGPQLRIVTKYKEDVANTRTDTVLMMMVDRIHGAHMGSGVHIRYAASDKKRLTVPWVEYQNSTTGIKRSYLAAGRNSVSGLPVFEMQCVDCHNRVAHSFGQPDRELDSALASGQIAMGLPFVKKRALELLKVDYKSGEEAQQENSGRPRSVLIAKNTPDVRAIVLPTSKQPATRSRRSMDAMCSPTSRLPGAPIRTIWVTLIFRAAFAAMTRVT